MTLPDTSSPALAVRLAALALLATALFAGAASAAKRTDVVTLANGDRITGEILLLDRGKLEVKTDDAGTIDFEWDKVFHVEAARQFEVGTTDGRRFLGSLGRAADRSIRVVGPDGAVTLNMEEVTRITPIGASFWKKLDGSFDVGFSYTRSSGIAQLYVNSDTLYRAPGFDGRLAASATVTRTNADGSQNSLGSIDASYIRYRWTRWFIAAGGRLETNESLGLKLRAQGGAAAGPRLVNTNRAQMILGGGIVVNNETGVETPSTQNVEGFVLFRTSYFTYDRPKTNLDLSFQYYPSLSDPGRHRLQLDASTKRELLKDFFVSLNLFDSYDSRPPEGSIENNDIGIVFSIGWSY